MYKVIDSVVDKEAQEVIADLPDIPKPTWEQMGSGTETLGLRMNAQVYHNKERGIIEIFPESMGWLGIKTNSVNIMGDVAPYAG